MFFTRCRSLVICKLHWFICKLHCLFNAMMNSTILLVESAEAEKVKKLKPLQNVKEGRTHSKLPRKTRLDLSLMVYSLSLN